MKSKNYFYLFLVLALVVGLFSGSALAQDKEIIIAGESEPGNLNSVIWPTTSDTNVTHMIYDCLLIPNEELEMKGELAKDWDISEDGKTYTFYLRENVKWHDGEPFTAEDVAFTFRSIAHPDYDAGSTSRVMPVKGAEAYRNGEADSIEGIEVVDDYTIKFTTEEPYAPFLSSLFIGVLPEHVLGDVNPGEWEKHESNRAPIGTGPFEFSEWRSGQYIELTANEDYFKGAPNLDTITYRFGDQNTMLSAFMNEEVDIAPLPISEVEAVEDLSFADLKIQDQLSTYYVGFNLRNFHFKNEDVRKALAYAIPKQLIVQSILGRFGNLTDDVFPDNHWSHSPDVKQFRYNPEKTAELLENAGYTKNSNGYYEKDGKELKFTFEVPTGTKARERTAVLLKQYWDRNGINCEIRSLDFPTLVTKLLPKTKDGKQREVTADDFHAYILGFGVEADPDEYRPYFHSDFMPPNGYNFCGYSDPEVDEMLDKQYKTVDFEERQEIIWDIGEKLSLEQPWIPIYEQSKLFVSNERITGFNPDFRGVSFKAEEWDVK